MKETDLFWIWFIEKDYYHDRKFSPTGSFSWCFPIFKRKCIFFLLPQRSCLFEPYWSSVVRLMLKRGRFSDLTLFYRQYACLFIYPCLTYRARYNVIQVNSSISNLYFYPATAGCKIINVHRFVFPQINYHVWCMWAKIKYLWFRRFMLSLCRPEAAVYFLIHISGLVQKLQMNLNPDHIWVIYSLFVFWCGGWHFEPWLCFALP